MKKLIALALLVGGLTIALLATPRPDPSDKKATTSYEEYVVLLKAGNTDINYTHFRDCYHATPIIVEKQALEAQLKEQLNKDMELGLIDEALSTLGMLLELDYTEISTHLVTAGCQQKKGNLQREEIHQEIALGLLESILSSGDGKSPETAWKVIQIPEEYIVLRVLNAEPQNIDRIEGNPAFDKIETTVNGKPFTFYFDVTKVVELAQR